MKSIFRPTSRKDFQQIKTLLCSVFQSRADEPILELAQMEWKYWNPRPDWEGSRSYVLERDGRMVAHGCAWPVSYGGRLRALHLIDWAAERTATGSGVLLLDKVAGLADCVISVGGSDMTKKVLPKLGFAPAGELKVFAQPIRPWRHALSHQRKGWRLPARLARNLIWSTTVPEVPAGWHSQPAQPAQIDVWPRDGDLRPDRGAAFYEYILRCPAATCRLFSVEYENRTEGYFCLSLVPGQARIAEMWMRSSDPATWAIGYGLALRQSAAMGATEVVAASSTDIGSPALTQAGYHLRQSIPILARASKGITLPRLQMEMVDGDAFFLHRGKAEFAS